MLQNTESLCLTITTFYGSFLNEMINGKSPHSKNEKIPQYIDGFDCFQEHMKKVRERSQIYKFSPYFFSRSTRFQFISDKIVIQILLGQIF